MYISILVIFVASLVIYYSGNKFAEASSEIGDYFNISRSVKGATLDAIAGSLPELLIVLFSILIFKEFSIGVGTIAGSVVFNLLIIPSLAVLVSPSVFKVSREVVARDGVFYIITILAFMVAILSTSSWGVAIGIVFIAIYFWYIDVIISQTKKFRIKNPKLLGDSISVTFKLISAGINVILIGIATYFLAKHAIIFSNLLGIPSLIIGFTIVAISTSIPDTVIALFNARKGHTDDVMSNVYGSNIFNILISLGASIFLASILLNPFTEVSFGNIELLIGLLVATIVVTYLIIDDYILTKKNAIFMIFMYVAFIGYLFFISV